MHMRPSYHLLPDHTYTDTITDKKLRRQHQGGQLQARETTPSSGSPHVRWPSMGYSLLVIMAVNDDDPHLMAFILSDGNEMVEHDFLFNHGGHMVMS